MKKIIRYLLVLLILITAIIAVLYLSLSSIVRYEIKKNSVAWTGRKIDINKLNLDLRHGIIDMRDVKIYEAGSDSLFVDCKDIYVKMNLRQLLKKRYEINCIKIDSSVIHIEQSGNKFSFDDIIKRFSSDKKDTAKSPVVQYYIDSIAIRDGAIVYNNLPIHNIFRINDLNLNIPEFDWDKPESKLHLDFKYGKDGGLFTFDLDANRKTLNYNLSLFIDKYDISQYYAPIKTILNIASVSGKLTAKLRIHGKFNEPEDMSFHGYLDLNNVELTDLYSRRFFAVRELSLDVDSVDPRHNHFDVNHFILDDPSVVYEANKEGSNFSNLIRRNNEVAKSQPVEDKGKGKIDYSNIFTMIQSSAKAMAIDFLHTNYHADSIAIRNGTVIINDNTANNKFHYSITRFNLVTSEINDLNEGVLFHASAKLGDSGRFIMKANLNFNPKTKKIETKVDSLKFLNISPIANYILKEYSMKLIGRKVTVGRVNLIVSRGGIFIKDLKIYEPDGKTLFFACHYVFVKIDISQLLENKYQIEKIKIDKPKLHIVQNGNKFNYDDILQRFASDSSKKNDTTRSFVFHYSVDSIMIDGATVAYTNIPMHRTLMITDLNFLLPQISWNNSLLLPHLDFRFGANGNVNLNMDINRNTSRYHSSLNINDIDLSQYYAPLKKYLNITSLKGTLSASLRLHGKLKNPAYFATSGSVEIKNLGITDTANRKVFGLGELKINIDTINVKDKMYYVRNITLRKPFMVFDYYTEGNNLSNMILNNQSASPSKGGNASGPDYSNIFTLLTSSLNMLAGDFFNTDFHTDSLLIEKGEVIYSDYTLKRDFHYDISDLNLSTDEISNSNNSISFKTSARLNNSGTFKLQANIGFHLKNMLFDYDVSNLRLTDINPYMEYYTGVPFVEGYLDYHSTDSVVNRYLKSNNQIHIKGIEMGKKLDDNPQYHLPVRFAVSLLKNDKDDINLQIPASGNLDDPNYKIGRLVGRILTDLVVKAVESPFKDLAKLFKKDPNDMKYIDIEYLHDNLTDKQQSKLDDIHEVLKKKKEMNVEIVQVTDSDAEADDLAIATAKAMYYHDTKHIVNDSLLTHRQRRKEKKNELKISSQDTLFNNYLNKKLHLTGNELIEVQDKCRMLVGEKIVEGKVHELIEKRNSAVSEYMTQKKGLAPERVKVSTSKDSIKIQNLVQPDFEINYNTGDK